jgi:predicted MPP superfamily phosphohydrolase
MSYEAAEIPEPVSLLLSGHTHCGQIAIPWTGYWGATRGVTRCGINRVDGRLLLMSAGLGQSTIPLRLGVPPDIWLLTLVANNKRARSQRDRARSEAP